MAQSAYPNGTDLTNFLTAQGFSAGSLDVNGLAGAAVDEFEKLTGRRMLALAGTDYEVTRRYDPPADGYLDLGWDLVTLAYVRYQPYGASAETLTQNVDFWLEPENAPNAYEPILAPYTGIRLRRRWRYPLATELYRSIIVRGTMGYGTALSEDVWQAMLQGAAALAAASLGNKVSSGYAQVSESGVQRTYRDQLAQARVWRETFERVARQYRRRSV